MTAREPEAPNPGPPSPGPAIDARGGPVADPSPNVLDLVNASIQRQDDLRAAESKHIREVLRLRTELGTQDSECAAEIADLRATHAQQLREAEAARIDAIRTVDQEALQRAADVQATQASALAATVAASAEAMRTQVAAAASAAATALRGGLDPIIKDIADLRQAQYEAQGQKAQVVETRSRGANTGLWIGVGIAGAVVFLGVLQVIVAVLASQ